MSTANRQHRPTDELRAIQPAPPRNLAIYLPQHRPYGAEEAATVQANFAKYSKANWRGPSRAVRRRYGVGTGPGFQRLTVAGRHVRGPHAPSHRPAQPEAAPIAA